MEFEFKLSSARDGGNKSEKQLSEIENTMKFYQSLEKVLKFYNDYFKIIHKTAYAVKLGQRQIIYSLYREKEIT